MLIMNIIKKLKFWFLDKFGERDTEKIYIGHGDFTERRGWWFNDRFYYYDGE